jgi:preprotein translocase subunit SecE
VAKKTSVTTTTTTAAPRRSHPIIEYFQATRAELRKVTWPTREEAQNLTMIIVTVSVAMALFLGLLDFFFQTVAGGIIVGNLVWIIVGVLLLAGGIAGFYFNGQQE